MTLPRVCATPFLCSEIVSPTDSPAVRPNFDGYGLARRLDNGDSDRSYNQSKRARVSSRARDETESRNRVHVRRRDSVSSSTRSRDKPASSKKSVVEESPLDWMRLDHERLAQRAQAIANQRRVQVNESSVEKSSVNDSTSIETSRTPLKPPPNSAVPPVSREHSSVKKNVPKRSDILTPSALNLSEITMSMSDLGSSQASDSNAMDIDNSDLVQDSEEAENELLNYN